MTPAETKIARSLVECKAFRPLLGMRGRWSSDGMAAGRICTQEQAEHSAADTDWLPDLSDPLTRLGVLHLVREAWGDETFYAAPFTESRGQVRWCASGMHRGFEYEGDTEIEALASALKAAPTPEGA